MDDFKNKESSREKPYRIEASCKNVIHSYKKLITSITLWIACVLQENQMLNTEPAQPQGSRMWQMLTH